MLLVVHNNKKIIIFDLGGVILDIHVERSFKALAMLGISADMLDESSCLMNSEGVTPDECIFYDDSAENCEAARSLGIDTVQLERNSSWGSAFDAF